MIYTVHLKVVSTIQTAEVVWSELPQSRLRLRDDYLSGHACCLALNMMVNSGRAQPCSIRRARSEAVYLISHAEGKAMHGANACPFARMPHTANTINMERRGLLTDKGVLRTATPNS